MIGAVALVSTAVAAVSGVAMTIDLVVTDPRPLTRAEGVTVSCLALGWLLATAFGVAAWVRDSRTRSRGDVLAGQIALGGVLASFIVIMLAEVGTMGRTGG